MRRTMAVLALAIASLATSTRADAQCCTLNLTPYSGGVTGITGPMTLGVTGGGSMTLTSTSDPSDLGGPAQLGNPGAASTVWQFGTHGLWRNRTGVFLNSFEGALTFMFNGDMRSSFVTGFIQFSNFCFEDSASSGCDPDGFGDQGPYFQALLDDNTWVSYNFTAADIHPGVDAGAYYTISTGMANIVGFRVGGDAIAISDVSISPEPASLALLGTGLVSVAAMVRRRRSA